MKVSRGIGLCAAIILVGLFCMSSALAAGPEPSPTPTASPGGTPTPSPSPALTESPAPTIVHTPSNHCPPPGEFVPPGAPCVGTLPVTGGLPSEGSGEFPLVTAALLILAGIFGLGYFALARKARPV